MTDRVNIPQLVAASGFTPSNRQIRARAQFHASNPRDSIPEDCNASQAHGMGAPAAVLKWWATPGFADWFLAPSWEQEESHRLLMQSMHRVSEILRDSEDERIVITAAREAREIYTRLNTTVAEKFADEEVAGMTRDQLADYIRRKTQAVAK